MVPYERQNRCRSTLPAVVDESNGLVAIVVKPSYIA